jgi:hypothetical protein
MKYFRTLLLNIDALGGGLIYGTPPGFYISTWVGMRYKGGIAERFINWLMQDSKHCEKSVLSQRELIAKYYKLPTL